MGFLADLGLGEKQSSRLTWQRAAGTEVSGDTCLALRERSVQVRGGPGTPASGQGSGGQHWKEFLEPEHQRPNQGASRGRDPLQTVVAHRAPE